MNMTEIISSYRNLRYELENQLERLAPLHASGMSCRKGCSKCCIHLALLPLEIYVMAEDLGLHYSFSGNVSGLKQCPFLKDHACSVYNERPVICRAFGFPQLWITEEWNADGLRLSDEESEKTVDWCEMNFPDRTPGEVLRDYSEKELLFMTPIKRKLNELNLLFLKQPEGAGFEPFERYFMGGLVC